MSATSRTVIVNGVPNGGYLRGCDGSSVTFRDELGASIHPQGDGMTHSGGVFAVEAWIAAAPIRREAA